MLCTSSGLRLVLFLLPSMFCNALAINSSLGQEEPAFNVEVEATLSKHPQAEFHMAECDLGVLPSGCKGSVTLLVKNPFAETFRFTAINKTCNCMNLKSDSYDIKGNSTQKFTMSLKTPPTAENAKVFSSISLMNGEAKNRRAVINLKVNYQLSGVLSIDPNMVLVEIPKEREFKPIKVPVLITAPIIMSELKIEASKTLRDLRFELVEESGVAYVVADVYAPAVEAGPISGEVRVIHEKSKRKDGFYVTARRVSSIRVSPSTLRFKSSKTDAEKMVAKALIRVAGEDKTIESDDLTNEKQEPDPIQASVTINGKAASVHLKKLSNRIYKATVVLETESLDEPDKKTAQWMIKNGEASERIDSKIVVVQ